MIMLNDKTAIKVKPTGSSDIMDRIINAIEIIKAEGYIVNSVHCSGKLFKEIARRFAPQLGYLEKKRFLVGPNKTPLLKDKNLIYNEEKQFYLKLTDPRNGTEGLMFPRFVKHINKPVNMEMKDG